MIVAAGLAIAAGTAMGGWRIIHTMGRRISDIETPQGFAAETASAAVILSAAHLGFALSTTQVATGAVVGSAAGRGAGAVRWRVAGRMAATWLLTLPSAAAMGALAAWVAAGGTAGTVLVGAVLVARLRRHLRPVAAHAGHRRQRQRAPGAAPPRSRRARPRGGLSRGDLS